MEIWHILLVSILLAGCIGGGGTGIQEPAGQGGVSIDIKGFSFGPKTIKVKKGTTVTWTNLDSASHTGSADNHEFESGALEKGDTFSYTCNDAGSYSYYCEFHPSMTGTIVVE